MQLDRQYLISALGYAVIGMTLGVYMGASHHHEQHVTHAHILLVGFVVSFIYGMIHKLWLHGPARPLAMMQFFAHHAGAIAMFVGLFLLFGGIVPESSIGPVLGIASTTVLAGMLLMLWMVLKQGAPAGIHSLRT